MIILLVRFRTRRLVRRILPAQVIEFLHRAVLFIKCSNLLFIPRLDVFIQWSCDSWQYLCPIYCKYRSLPSILLVLVLVLDPVLLVILVFLFFTCSSPHIR